MPFLDAPFRPARGSAPVLLWHSYEAERSAFARARDTNTAWTLLAPERGTLLARIGEGEAREVSFGAWVVCPPQISFWREVMSAPLTFHCARFEWPITLGEFDALAGVHSTPHLDRLSENFAAWRALARDAPARAHTWREHLLWDVLELGSREAAIEQFAASAEMERARELIEAGLESGVSLALVAARLELSPVALTRQFRAAFGQTPSQFLLARRLERARHLLVATNWPLDRVAARCGLGSGFYLSRVWSKQFGITPARFRRERQI